MWTHEVPSWLPKLGRTQTFQAGKAGFIFRLSLLILGVAWFHIIYEERDPSEIVSEADTTAEVPGFLEGESHFRTFLCP